ncbi:MAG: pilus assembly protein PilM [Planctomycetota bacterium]
MASYLGLDLSPTRLRAIEVEGSVKKPVVRRFAVLEFERLGGDESGGGMVQIESARIADFLKQNKFVRDPAVLGIDSLACVFRELDLPFTGEEQIRKVVKFEAESHLQSPLDEVIVNFKKLGKLRDKSHLLVMAARKDRIFEKLKLVNDAGVDPYSIDVDVGALYNALVALNYPTEHPNFAVLDCEPTTTSVLLFSDGELVAARTIRMGSSSLEGAAAAVPAGSAEPDRGELLVLEDEGEEARADIPTSLPPAAPLAPPSGSFDKLSRELRRMMVTLRLKAPLDVVYLTGPGAALAGFGAVVAQELGAPARELDIAERVDSKVELGPLANELAVPLGLGLKLMGHDASRIDFRQEECRYAKKFDQIKVPLACLAMVVLIFIALLDLYKFRVYRAHEQERQDITRLVKKEYQLYGGIDGEPAPLAPDLAGSRLVNKVREELRSRRDDLRSKLGREGSIPGLPSALTAMGVFFRTLDRAKQRVGPIVLTKVDINLQSTDPSLQIQALVRTRQAYEDLRTALAAEKDYFTQVGDSPTEAVADNWFKVPNLPVKLNKEALVVK